MHGHDHYRASVLHPCGASWVVLLQNLWESTWTAQKGSSRELFFFFFFLTQENYLIPEHFITLKTALNEPLN